jgi:hypothetical protein
MNHAHPFGSIEGSRDIATQGQSILGGEGVPSAEALVEGDSLEKLHRDELGAVVFSGIKHAGEMLATKLPHHRDLSVKARHKRGVVMLDDLDSNGRRVGMLEVSAAIDGAHAASSKQGE